MAHPPPSDGQQQLEEGPIGKKNSTQAAEAVMQSGTHAEQRRLLDPAVLLTRRRAGEEARATIGSR